MTDKKQAPFETEAEEAEWWFNNQDLIADRFEQAEAAGTLGEGMVARAAQARSEKLPAVPIRPSHQR